MQLESEIYDHYCRWCRSLDIEPAPYEVWSTIGVTLSRDEVIRHEGDKFLAKLHPDGSNLAGLRDGKRVAE